MREIFHNVLECKQVSFKCFSLLWYSLSVYIYVLVFLSWYISFTVAQLFTSVHFHINFFFHVVVVPRVSSCYNCPKHTTTFIYFIFYCYESPHIFFSSFFSLAFFFQFTNECGFVSMSLTFLNHMEYGT